MSHEHLSKPEPSIAETTERTARIRELNDVFRRSRGAGGHLLVTQGVLAFGGEAVTAIVRAVAAYDDFNRDNDPHGEHDFGAFGHHGQKIFWKIDCYAPDLVHGSEDPSDPDATTRVLTIMCADEY